MLNFIKADILRILKKKSYILATAIVFALYALVLIILLKKAPDFVEIANSLLADVALLVVGIPVFTSVFSDDFNSKAMQTVIGSGTSRRRLVLSRFCEYIVILGQAFLVLTVMILAIFAFTGYMPEANSTLGFLWRSYLLAILCVSVAMIFVYGLQNPTMGLVIFLAFVLDVFGLIFIGLSFISFFAEHNIDPSAILPGSLINSAFSNGKTINLLYAFIGYIVIPQIITVKIFEKRELEF